MKRSLTDNEILSIFVSYLDQDVLVSTPLTRVSPLTLEWIHGLYYGHDIIFDLETDRFVAGTLTECRLILKPLKITDELCLSLGNDFYLGYSKEEKIATVRNQLGALKFGGQCDHRIIAKLKAVGIAVPYVGVDLFKLGVAVTEEEADKLVKEAPEIDFVNHDEKGGEGDAIPDY